MSSVSLVTVNFNHSYLTEALLESIDQKNTYQQLEIIVVDNGSRDNPVPGWLIKYPHVQFIRSAVNLGFAGGNNLGLKVATGDYLFLINNDTEITECLIETLAATLDEHPEVGMVSPKIKYFDEPEMLQYAGFTPMDYYTCRNRCIGLHEIDKGQYDNLTGPTGYIHGAAMMIRRTAIEKAGLMPEVYFLYYEEMDWVERMKKAGYTIWVNMQALIYHKESVSVGGKSALKEYFMNRNRILFIRRNCGPGIRLVFWPYFISVVATRNIKNYIRDKQWPFVPILLKAIWWNVTHNKNSTDLGFKIKN
jgi:GT2 family glycosyltransferase